MSPVLVLVLVLVAVLVAPVPVSAAPASPTSCVPTPPLPGPGSATPFRAPAARATELNTAAKVLYRQGKWDEARAQYRAALAVDPDFLAPRLNVACSYVRQDRFREATAEVLALLDRGFVPWSREILEAADLGALKVRPEMTEVRRAMSDAAARWGEGLDEAVLFVARPRPPLRVPPEGAGVFILNPHQEVWALLPRTGRYRQLTAEDGRVLALARPPGGNRIAYVTAEKLVRGTGGATDVALRGVELHELTLTTMTAAPPVRIAGDVRLVEIAGGVGGSDFVVRIESDEPAARGSFALRGSGLTPLPPRARHGPVLAVLTGSGARAPARAPRAVALDLPGCAVTVREVRGGAPALSASVAGRKGKPLAIESGAGAALVGLPIP